MQKKTYILLSIILIVSSAFLLVNRSEVKRDLSNIKAKRSTFQSKKISNATLRKTSHSAIKKEDQQKTAFTKNSQEKKDTKTEEKSLEPIKILYSDQNKTVMAFSLPEFSIEETTFSERKVSIIKAAKNGVLKAKNKPALPVYRTNIIIPENSEVSVSYSDTSFDEIPIKQPIPSTGFISRTQPKTTPTFSNIYDNPLPYPEKSVRVTKNYKIRSIQAVGIIVQPFQYYPQKKILKIYKNLIITVNTTHATDEKPLLTKIPTGEFAESAKIYFANYEQATRGQEDTDETGGRGGERGSATPLPENNKLLVIVPDNVNFADSSIDEFIEWKRERGLTVEKVLYPTDTGGSGSTALEAYLQNKYDTENIAFVIFIGDYEDIPVIDSTDNPSDTLYTRVSGTDYYHDFLISRISAQNNEEVANQLTKIINYEKSPQGSGWLTKALFVASNEGASQSSFDKDDWEILEEEWDDTQDDTGLSEYGYTEITKLYDSHYPYPDDSGSPSSFEVSSAINDGCGLAYYLGHGTETSWVSTGFNTSHIGSLTNSTMLPFVMNGNCQTGAFTRTAGDCFAEAFMKAGSAESPNGAIGVTSSTTSMDWDPPIILIQSFTNNIYAETLSTLGGLCTLSLQQAMDWCYDTPGEGATAAELIMEQTHLFGDCTLGLRTKKPATLEVSHQKSLNPDANFSVSVKVSDEPLENASISLYSSNGEQFTSKTDSAGNATLSPTTITTQTIKLTVYHRNAIAYQTDLPIIREFSIISDTTLPNATVGKAYSFSHIAVSGTELYAWSANGLPAWLTLNTSNGTVSGTASLSDTFQYTIYAEDAESATNSQTISIFAGNAVEIQSVSLPSKEIYEEYSYQFSAIGDFSPFSYSLNSGTLPNGFSLNSSGLLSGTPTTADTYQFTILATDTEDNTDSTTYSLEISPMSTIQITTAQTLFKAIKDTTYNTQLSAIGGDGIYYWSLAPGHSLPTGLTLSSDGSINGTPITSGNFSFAVKARDNQFVPLENQKLFNLTVDASVYFPNTYLNYGVTAEEYSFKIEAEGSNTPITYSSSIDGYTYKNEDKTFNKTGTEKTEWKNSTPSDDNEWPLTLPFTFQYYGTEYTSCKVGDNGYIILGENTSPPDMWQATESFFLTSVMIAPFWNDLVITENYSETGIFVEEDPNYITIRWKGREYHDIEEGWENNWFLNFSLTLYKNGEIRFSYGTIDTSNRIVVGVSNADSAMNNLIYSHDWNEGNPDHVTEWTNHQDILFSLNQNLPSWLSIATDGTLSGTPTSSGTYDFSLTAKDSQSEKTTTDFSLTIYDTQQNTPDKNSDNIISDTELLLYLERYGREEVNKTDADTTVSWWKTGKKPRRERDLSEEGDKDLRTPQIDTTDYIIATVLTKTRERLSIITQSGINVINRIGNITTVKITQRQLKFLIEQGFHPQIADSANKRESRSEEYYTYSTLTTKLQDLVTNYPALCVLSSIGKSVQNRDIWALKITDNPSSEEAEPEICLASTMHGDEPVGTELCVSFIELLLTSYGNTDEEGLKITDAINNSEIWILPLLNPDGLEAEPATRTNANGVDLNRNFPDRIDNSIGNVFDGPGIDSYGVQPETQAIMQWSIERNLVLDMNFHTGAHLVTYPYGNNESGASDYTTSPDDSTYIRLAQNYVNLNSTMSERINAADWYRVVGEMADWKYTYLGSLSLTTELSVQKTPVFSQVESIWNNNKDSFLDFVCSVNDSTLRGLVQDSATGDPVYAKVTVSGISQPIFSDSDKGDYCKFLEPGTYTVTFSASGYYDEVLLNVDITDENITKRNVSLTPNLNPDLYVTRTFPSENYQNGKNQVNLYVNLPAESPPKAYIVSETIPENFRYCELSSYTGTSIDDPIISNNTLKWLFWGDEAVNRSISYEVSSPYCSAEQVAFLGKIITSSAESATTGDSNWNANSANTQFTMTLEPGWNLISFPCNLTSQSKETFYELIKSIWNWNGNVYVYPEHLTYGRGYWVNCISPSTLTLEGTPPETWNTNLGFASGWNLFGPLFASPLPEDENLAGKIWKWENNEYRNVTDLKIFSGYWLYGKDSFDSH